MSSKEILCEFSTENSKLANFEKMKDDTRIISENQEFEVQDITNVSKVTDFGNQSGIMAVDESNKKDGFLDIEDNLGDGSFQETEEFKVQDNTNVPKVTDFVIKSAILAEEFEVQENTNVPEVTDFAMKTGLLAGDESNNKDGFLGKCLNVEDNLGDGSFQDSEVAVMMKDETRIIPESVSTIQEFESSTKKDETNKGNCLNIENLGGSNSVRCSLKIEVIDDTAMIDISQAGKRINRKKKKNTNQENGEKRVARKENGPKLVEAKEKHVCFDGCKREGEEKRVYSRKELENLRFSGMEEQRKKWLEVYCGLGHAVQKEYDALIHSNNSQNQFNSRRRRGKENTPVVSGNDPLQHLDDQEGYIHTRNSPSAFPLNRDDGISYEEGESNVYEETDDSDDDYSSIQRPAFMVTGEPDFDSGPPDDGLEYLRRVRWEEAQLPKVKVAKVERSKLNKEQTFYMPQLPDIASCQEDLLPLKEWEEAFLADFSELRQVLSRVEANGGTHSQLHSAPCVHQKHSSNQLPEGIVVDMFDASLSGEDDSCASDAGDDPTIDTSIPKSSPVGGFGNSPTLSVILRMDAVSRVSMLKKRITAVQSMSNLPRDDCLWLFALCAAVDTPLDADTCAALRSLLRKCASLRAEKTELDDEVIMLNLLATISGKYFGQSEK